MVQYAQAAAEAMGAKLGGKGTVAVTVGCFNQTENLVAETFKATMAEKYPDIKVLDPQEEGFDAAQAIAKAAAIIQGNPDITGAFSTTGNGPTTWARAAEDTSKEDLVIISMDYTRPNLDLVKEGKVYGLVAQPLYEEFYACAETSWAKCSMARQSNTVTCCQPRSSPPPISTKYYEFNDRAEAGIEGETVSRSSRLSRLRLAMIQFLKGHPVHRLMQLGFQEGCKAPGYECDMLLTDSTSAVDMIPLAEQALANRLGWHRALCCGRQLLPHHREVQRRRHPGRAPRTSPASNRKTSGLTAVVGADVVQYAQAAAEAMGAKLGGKGTVAVTVGTFNQTENLVAETFKATMAEKYPDIKVLDPQEEGFDAAQAIAKAVAIIQGNPDITGAFSTTGNGPTTWATRR